VVDFNSDGRAEVFYKLFNKRFGEVLLWTGARMRSLRKLERIPLCVFRKNKRAKVVYGIPQPGTNHFKPEIELADINRATGRKIDLPYSLSALRCWQSKEEETPWIVAVDRQGRMLRLDQGWKVRQLPWDAGAGFGVTDFDSDGQPELVLSEPVWPGEPDSVRVIESSEVVWQTREVLGGVTAVASGAIGDTFKAIVLAAEPSASRIYLVER
jgi:hypothetical protein